MSLKRSTPSVLKNKAMASRAVKVAAMPGLTGGELASEMLALCPGLPIIICTGYTDKLSTESESSIK